uniref:PHD-type domain-containing protein n=2 Tax=Panagrolaimus sp. JU765 TaxID=591449 RepID=A0AC34Q5I0_9BILA
MSSKREKECYGNLTMAPSRSKSKTLPSEGPKTRSKFKDSKKPAPTKGSRNVGSESAPKKKKKAPKPDDEWSTDESDLLYEQYTVDGRKFKRKIKYYEEFGIEDEIKEMKDTTFKKERYTVVPVVSNKFKRLRSRNVDICVACDESGEDLLTCVRCPASFHALCISGFLPLKKFAHEPWMCRRCKYEANVMAKPRRMPKVLPFNEDDRYILMLEEAFKKESADADMSLDQALDMIADLTNPRVFTLQKELLDSLVDMPYMEHIPRKTECDLESFCYNCKRHPTAELPAIQCDYCPSVWHLHCLERPMTTVLNEFWMCPLHGEVAIDRFALDSNGISKRMFYWDRCRSSIKTDKLLGNFMEKIEDFYDLEENAEQTCDVPPCIDDGHLITLKEAEELSSIKHYNYDVPRLLPGSFNSSFTQIFEQAAQFLETNSTLSDTQEELLKYARDIAFSCMTVEKFVKLPAKRMFFEPFLDISPIHGQQLIRRPYEDYSNKFGAVTSEDLRPFSTFFSSKGGSKSLNGLSYISVSELYYPLAPQDEISSDILAVFEIRDHYLFLLMEKLPESFPKPVKHQAEVDDSFTLKSAMARSYALSENLKQSRLTIHEFGNLFDGQFALPIKKYGKNIYYANFYTNGQDVILRYRKMVDGRYPRFSRSKFKNLPDNYTEVYKIEELEKKSSIQEKEKPVNEPPMKCDEILSECQNLLEENGFEQDCTSQAIKLLKLLGYGFRRKNGQISMYSRKKSKAKKESMLDRIMELLEKLKDGSDESVEQMLPVQDINETEGITTDVHREASIMNEEIPCLDTTLAEDETNNNVVDDIPTFEETSPPINETSPRIINEGLEKELEESEESQSASLERKPNKYNFGTVRTDGDVCEEVVLLSLVAEDKININEINFDAIDFDALIPPKIEPDEVDKDVKDYLVETPEFRRYLRKANAEFACIRKIVAQLKKSLGIECEEGTTVVRKTKRKKSLALSGKRAPPKPKDQEYEGKTSKELISLLFEARRRYSDLIEEHRREGLQKAQNREEKQGSPVTGLFLQDFIAGQRLTRGRVSTLNECGVVKAVYDLSLSPPPEKKSKEKPKKKRGPKPKLAPVVESKPEVTATPQIEVPNRPSNLPEIVPGSSTLSRSCISPAKPLRKTVKKKVQISSTTTTITIENNKVVKEKPKKEEKMKKPEFHIQHDEKDSNKYYVKVSVGKGKHARYEVQFMGGSNETGNESKDDEDGTCHLNLVPNISEKKINEFIENISVPKNKNKISLSKEFQKKTMPPMKKTKKSKSKFRRKAKQKGLVTKDVSPVIPVKQQEFDFETLLKLDCRKVGDYVYLMYKSAEKWITLCRIPVFREYFAFPVSSDVRELLDNKEIRSGLAGDRNDAVYSEIIDSVVDYERKLCVDKKWQKNYGLTEFAENILDSNSTAEYTLDKRFLDPRMPVIGALILTSPRHSFATIPLYYPVTTFGRTKESMIELSLLSNTCHAFALRHATIFYNKNNCQFHLRAETNYPTVVDGVAYGGNPFCHSDICECTKRFKKEIPSSRGILRAQLSDNCQIQMGCLAFSVILLPAEQIWAEVPGSRPDIVNTDSQIVPRNINDCPEYDSNETDTSESSSSEVGF